ncbi:TetR/AcrR family transcriptional regulator [Streptomyces globisporus]|uniref:TetR/AcrR family transcriptional regulator n=1 Tax=Streptomyces globisporus TaxID=1908 RepID=A0A927BI98_STRGL|nr:TetR/AcrR family transcriptional regulator [Streptomyces globisporus]
MTEEELNRHQRAAETKRRRTKEAIINGALELYEGLDKGDFTRDEIAEAAGVGSATLHKNFGGKYEVLKLTHERLLEPIIEPVIEGFKADTYHPKDGVDELLRFLYRVTKTCRDNRALTNAMIRAYYETPPDQRRDLIIGVGYKQLEDRLDTLLGGYIAHGLCIVLDRAPFMATGPLYGETFFEGGWISGIRGETTWEITRILLERLYHLTGGEEDVPVKVTREIANAIVDRYARDVPVVELGDRLDRIKVQVDAQDRTDG